MFVRTVTLILIENANQSRPSVEARIYQLSLPIAALIAIQNSLDAFLAVEKYLLVKREIFKNTMVRGPVGYQLDEEMRLEVNRLFEQLQAVLK